MRTKKYPSDLTDEEWRKLQEVFEDKAKTGRPRKVKLREIWDAIFYILRTGGSWRQLPHDYPKWQLVYYYFSKWKKKGIIEDVHDKLRREIRVKNNKEEEPSLGIIDSQSVKTAEKGG